MILRVPLFRFHALTEISSTSAWGVAMLSCVLHSDVAIKTNAQIMRTFVQIRRLGLSVIDI